VVALVMALGLAGAAAPASADSADAAILVVKNATAASCPTTRICLYSGVGLTGDMRAIPAVLPGECAPVFGLGIVIQSALNLTGVTQRIWTSRACSGSNFVLGNRVSVNYLHHQSVGGYP
jgi:hypothetical protein